MKSIILEGTVEEAPCESCGRFVDATYAYGQVEVEAGLFADNVMRATCNCCGAVTAIAGQSAHRLRKAIDEKGAKKTTLRLPQELLDFVNFRLSLAGATSSQDGLFFQALLLACRNQENSLGKLLAQVSDLVLSRPYREMVHLTLSPQLAQILENLKVASGLANGSEILRRLVVLADTDVLEMKAAEKLEELVLIAA